MSVPANRIDSTRENNASFDTDALLAPQLTLAKTIVGDSFSGRNGTDTLQVTNGSTPTHPAATSGVISIEDALPVELALVSGAAANWAWAEVGQVVTCISAPPSRWAAVAPYRRCYRYASIDRVDPSSVALRTRLTALPVSARARAHEQPSDLETTP
ncbi:hypothetical protein [Lysobacter sp. Hz 25]|uniref:hypothetical protein n=1 Tax=Lysobacter sp. Hz 25 TaxID=3383698 RepID=UPI0038D426B4